MGRAKGHRLLSPLGLLVGRIKLTAHIVLSIAAYAITPGVPAHVLRVDPESQSIGFASLLGVSFRPLACSLVTQNMNRPGKATDNALMESCFNSMEADVINTNEFGGTLG